MCTPILHLPPPPTSTLFPYTTLFRSTQERIHYGKIAIAPLLTERISPSWPCCRTMLGSRSRRLPPRSGSDRKSTLLNSSDPSMSYAVCCSNETSIIFEARRRYELPVF